MPKPKGTLKTCNRGHQFYKSSDCPICPICWSGYYKDKLQSDFPEKLGAPALRALLHNGIKKLSDVTKYTQQEVASWHGIGPKGVKMIKDAMLAKKMDFKK